MKKKVLKYVQTTRSSAMTKLTIFLNKTIIAFRCTFIRALSVLCILGALHDDVKKSVFKPIRPIQRLLFFATLALIF